MKPAGSKRHRALLITYLWPRRRQALLLLLLLLAVTGLRLLNPLLLARFIDAVVAGGALANLWPLALAFLAVALLMQFLGVAENYLATDLGLSATNQLRADLALHCLQLDMAFHNNRTPGELIERVDGDVGHLSNFFGRFVVDLVGNAILLLGVLIALLRIDWRVGLALALFSALALYAAYHLRNLAVDHFTQSRQAHADLFGFLEERLAGTEDVRSSGATAYVLRRFHERARALFRIDLKAHLFGGISYSTLMVIFALGTGLALALGALLFLRGVVTVGVVYLIYRYTELLIVPIEQFGRQLQDLQLASAAIIRVEELLSTAPAIVEQGVDDLPTGALAVQVADLSFRYPAATPDHTAAPTDAEDFTLRNLSFALAPGAVLGLLGRTGSGKTTLTRLLLRLYTPTTGAIQLNGLDLGTINPHALRQRVGIVTQEIQLFHATVRDNLTLFAPDIADERILTVLRELGLGRWYEQLPAGLETKLSPGASGLSGGEAQLLAFVRIFLRDPGLVILDEASSRLDPATEALLERAVERLLHPIDGRRTAIIIAHRLATVARADQILILEQGRCVEFGPRAQLAANPQSRFAQLLRTGLEEALA